MNIYSSKKNCNTNLLDVKNGKTRKNAQSDKGFSCPATTKFVV